MEDYIIYVVFKFFLVNPIATRTVSLWVKINHKNFFLAFSK